MKILAMINPGLPERSPADSKIMAYADISNSDFIIKGFRFDVSSFLDNPVLAQNTLSVPLLSSG